MKKLILLAFLTFCLSVSIYSESDTYLDSFLNSHMLIKNDLFKNFVQIKEHSRDLEFAHKAMLFNEFEKKALEPVFLNIMIPFGIGSFLNDDKVGGWIIFGGDILTVSLASFAYFSMYSENYYNSYNNGLGTQEILLYSAGIVLLINSIIKIARPLAFTSNYNAKLEDALNFHYPIKFSVIPTFDLTSTGDVLAAVNLKLSY